MNGSWGAEESGDEEPVPVPLAPHRPCQGQCLPQLRTGDQPQKSAISLHGECKETGQSWHLDCKNQLSLIRGYRLVLCSTCESRYGF